MLVHGRVYYYVETGGPTLASEIHGSAVSFDPSGSGRSPAAKRILVHFEVKIKHYVA